jgi:hypothetical protein
MTISDKQKQQKLLKKKQKRAAVVKAAKAWGSNVSALSCAGYPLHECVVQTNLFELGLGEVFVTRRLPDGKLGVSVFLVDVFCLGVKNAFFRVVAEDEYDSMKQSIVRSGRNLERIHQSCAKKLLQGAVEYAKNLGFSAHPDYKKAAPLFGNSEASVCPVHYDYGKNGKPYYFRGPNESISEAKKIVNKLQDKCGEGGFEFMIQLDDGFNDDD